MELETLIIDKIVLLNLESQQYDIQITSYTSTLTSLPIGNIPSDVVDYMNIPISNLPADMEYSDVSLISAYKYREYLQKELIVSKTEKEKAELMRQSLYEQLPSDTRDQLILDAAAALNAQPAQ